eukprot:Gb_05584 [translate_table: standard]
MDEHQKYGQPYPPPGYQPQQPPYGYPPPSQGYPPQGYPPQGYPQQGYPPAQGYYQQTPPVVAPPQYNQQQQSNSSSSTGFLQGWCFPLYNLHDEEYIFTVIVCLFEVYALMMVLKSLGIAKLLYPFGILPLLLLPGFKPDIIASAHLDGNVCVNLPRRCTSVEAESCLDPFCVLSNTDHTTNISGYEVWQDLLVLDTQIKPGYYNALMGSLIGQVGSISACSTRAAPYPIRLPIGAF